MIAPDRLLQHLHQRFPAALDLLREMVGINSWTENREGVNRVGRLTASAFEPLGFAAEFVASCHSGWGDHLVMSRAGRSGRVVGMVSHLDTVFPPEEEERNGFRWSVEGRRVFGPGTHDIKGGTVLMWLVLDALKSLAPEVWEQLGWRLFWNSSEEMLSPDFGALCRARLDPSGAIALVFEAEGRGPGVRRLVVARKGRGTWRVEVAGRGAHAGVHHARGANAIVQLARTLERIASLTDSERDLTVNVGVVRGGGGLNRVPHLAEAEGEFRAFTPEVYAWARARLQELAGPGTVCSPFDGFPCQVTVDIRSETRPWPRNPATDDLIAHFVAAATDFGDRVEPESRGGLSDGNSLWDHVPTLDGLGPSGDNDHCSERSPDGSKLPEYADLDSFVPKAALNVLAILRWFREQQIPLP
ncbi:MAG: M20/M25/M40 family metallo-hydrolase [Verrucomicrobiae bacterium]|nr:M20/M25/M40 family metallo-hydrolase [Verrucomicrobiae bacterium]